MLVVVRVVRVYSLLVEAVSNLTIASLFLHRVVGINGLVELYITNEDLLDVQFRGLNAGDFLRQLAWVADTSVEKVRTCGAVVFVAQ